VARSPQSKSEAVIQIENEKVSTVNPFPTSIIDKEVFSNYNEITAASSVESDVVSYTVPAEKTARVWRIHASGEASARFRLKLNGTIIASGRISWTDRNWQPTFGDIEGTAGDIFKITVIHTESSSKDYWATISGIIF